MSERKLFDDYSKRGSQELAGMLIDIEKSMDKRRRQHSKERSQLTTTLRRLADAAETLVGSDRESNPSGHAADEEEFERALAAARSLLKEFP